MRARENDDRRWDEARRAVIRRWRRALDRVTARDEPGTLALVNEMDEFCQEAIRARTLATGDPLSQELRCRFCPEAQRTGGCLGLVGALNHMVLSGLWDEAALLVHERLRELGGPADA